MILLQLLCNFRNERLAIHDGNSTESPVLGKYCGHDSIPPSTISTSNQILVYFSSKGTSSNNGVFKLEYRPNSK